MKYELDITGVLVPSMMLWIVIAYVLSTVLTAQLRRVGFYRLVWHRALFDFSIFVCLLGGVVYVSSEYLS